MKKIGILSFLVGLLLVTSCQEEYLDYKAPDDLSDVSWIIGFSDSQNPYNIAIDTHMSLVDVSQGTIEHEWIIDETMHYLNEGFTRTDSLPLFIKEGVGTNSIDKKAHVLFTKKGEHGIRLLNKFKDSVTFNSSELPLGATKVGDFWVIDTTFTFDIYGHILPAFSVYKRDDSGNEELILEVTEEDLILEKDQSTWPVESIESGETLIFKDNTVEGRPTSRSWTINRGIPGNSNQADIETIFYNLGQEPAGSIRVIRSGEGIPAGNQEKLIPLMVNVLPSSAPFVYDGVMVENEDETIRFRVNGPLKTVENEEANFVVNVQNGVFNQNITVTQAKISDDNNVFVELTLQDPIYNSDMITVEYKGGNIKSLDERTLAAFDPVSVVTYRPNVLSSFWAGFETRQGGQSNGWMGPARTFWIGGGVNNGPGGDPMFSQSGEQAFAGDNSMKFSIAEFTGGTPNNYQCFTFGLGMHDKLDGGRYVMSFRVFVPESTNITTFETRDIAGLAQTWDISGVEKGKWVRIEKLVENVPSIQDRTRMTIFIDRGANPGATGRQTMYFDEFNLQPIEERP